MLKEGRKEKIKFDVNKKYDYSYIDNRPYYFKYASENNTLVIVYRSCREIDNYPMSNFIDEIDLLVKEKEIKNVVIDLRGNLGGNSIIIKPLVDYLEKSKVYTTTLIDKSVFSSGIFAIIDLDNIGSKFVGIAISTPINHFGNCASFILPNSKIKVWCSTMYYYLDGKNIKKVNKDNFSRFFSNQDNRDYFLPNFFEPDIYVENSLEDLLNGFDRQLFTAINLNK